MKFSVKSALPSAAIAMLAISTVAKVEKALSLPDNGWDTQTYTESAPGLENNMSANDSLGAGDSFGSGDSSGSSDSMSANNSFGSCNLTAQDSSGFCGGGNIGRGVFVIERDFVQDGQMSGEFVTDTLCFKYDRNQIIAQSVNPPEKSYLALGEFTSPYMLDLKLLSDPNVKGDRSASISISKAYYSNEWTGAWMNSKGRGDAKAVVMNNVWAYASFNCNYLFGNN